MSDRPQKIGVRATMSTSNILAGVDDFMEECRQKLAESDPAWADLDEGYRAQAAVSLAVQRILHWAERDRGRCEDRDTIPSQAIVGVLTGVGIGSAMFGYDHRDISTKAKLIIHKSSREAREALGSWNDGPRGPWDA